MSKKRPLRLWLLVFAVFLVCVGTQVSAVASEKPFAGKTITAVMIYDRYVKALEQMFPEFEKETGIKIKYDVVPYANLHEKMVLDYAAGTAKYALGTMIYQWLGEFAEADFILCLEDYVQRGEINMADILPGVFKTQAEWKDKIYTIPGGGYYNHVHYRKDKFAAAGIKVPETAEEFIKAAAYLTKPEEKFWGVAFNNKRGGPICHDWSAWYAGFGGRTFVDQPYNYRSALNGPIGLYALKFHKELLNYAPPGAMSYDWKTRRIAMQRGTVAMMPGFSSQAPVFEEPEISAIVGKVGYTNLPVRLPGQKPVVPMGGSAFVINKDSKKADADVCWEFIKWVLDPQVHKIYAELGGTPVLFSTISDPELQEKFPWYPLVLQDERRGLPDPAIRYMTKLPEFAQMEEIIGLRINQAVIGELGNQEALDKIVEEINSLMRKNGYPVIEEDEELPMP